MALNVVVALQAVANFTISLAGLTNGSARQGTMIANTVGYPAAIINLKIKSGTAPTAGTIYEVYLIRSDGTIADDNAGATDAAITILNSTYLGGIAVTASANTNFYGVFDTYKVGPLGPNWTIAIKNSSGQSLNATEANHTKDYTYYCLQNA